MIAVCRDEVELEDASTQRTSTEYLHVKIVRMAIQCLVAEVIPAVAYILVEQ